MQSRHPSCICMHACMQMFEMDAYVGVDVLGLSFMKGEQPHAGEGGQRALLLS